MPEQQEERKIFYDADLNIEAYSLCGIVQRFPKHFHDYYVIAPLYFIISGLPLFRSGIHCGQRLSTL